MEKTRKHTNEVKMVKELKKAQKVLVDIQYPGYPFQESFILTKDKCYLELQKCTSREIGMNKLYAELLYQVVGCCNSDKPSWYQERKIATVNEFTDPRFENKNLYIDNDVAARFYLAIQSALCEIQDKQLQDVIVWGCIDMECEWCDVKIFTNLKQVVKYVKDNFTSYNE